jgi:hypothetical protein
MEVWVLKVVYRDYGTTPTLRILPQKQVHFCAYGETYGLPYVLTNCSNYGPFTFH